MTEVGNFLSRDSCFLFQVSSTISSPGSDVIKPEPTWDDGQYGSGGSQPITDTASPAQHTTTSSGKAQKDHNPANYELKDSMSLKNVVLAGKFSHWPRRKPEDQTPLFVGTFHSAWLQVPGPEVISPSAGLFLLCCSRHKCSVKVDSHQGHHRKYQNCKSSFGCGQKRSVPNESGSETDPSHSFVGAWIAACGLDAFVLPWFFKPSLANTESTTQHAYVRKKFRFVRQGTQTHVVCCACRCSGAGDELTKNRPGCP